MDALGVERARYVILMDILHALRMLEEARYVEVVTDQGYRSISAAIARLEEAWTAEADAFRENTRMAHPEIPAAHQITANFDSSHDARDLAIDGYSFTMPGRELHRKIVAPPLQPATQG